MMRKPATCVVLVLLAGACAPAAHASGTSLTGSGFLDACTRADESWISFCNGYVQAAVDEAQREGDKLCPPPGTTRTDIVENAVSLLQRAPELQSMNAADVVHRELLSMFPCK